MKIDKFVRERNEENRRRVANGEDPLPDIERILDLHSYDNADNLHTNMQNQQTRIFVQREELQRRQNAANRNNGGGH